MRDHAREELRKTRGFGTHKILDGSQLHIIVHEKWAMCELLKKLSERL